MRSLPLFFTTVVVLACNGGGGSPDAGTDTPPDAALATITGFAATENPSNVLSYYVEWSTEPAAPTHLEVDCGPDYQHTFAGDAARTDHRVFVMGLWDGARCALRTEVEIDGDVAAVHEEAIDVGPLPAFLPEVYLHAHDVIRTQPGWTLFNLTNGTLGEPFKIALIDTDGRYRWYHELDVTHQGGDNDTRVVSEGVLIGGLWHLIDPTIVDWEGNVVWREDFSMHHDIRPDGDPDRLLHLGHTTDCPEGIEGSNAVRLWDRELGEVVWEWKTCDHYPPEETGLDWDHLNTIEHVPDEDALLLSSRNMNRLIKIDRSTGDILWELGPEADFQLAVEDWFYHQHDPDILENGNIVLFDNGLDGVRNWSRAIEIAYDETEMTAEVVWSYRPQPDIFAPIWSDADRLPNGNTLIAFGRRAADNDSHLIEASPESDKVWHVSFPPGWGLYRAQRVPDPPHGEVLD